MRIKFIAIIFFFAIAQSTYSQMVHSEGRPLGLPAGEKMISWFDPGIPQTEIDEVREAAQKDKGLLRFAITRETDLNRYNSGVITRQKGDINTWHLLISSDNAASLALVFSSFRMKQGEKVFIYDPGMNNILGPFTSLNNKESGVLPVLPLEGSQLVLEYQFLKKGGGELEVGQVGHDALGVFGRPLTKDEDFGSSGPCNIDINCESGEEWSDEKRAVVKLVITGNEYIYLGTGILVNNTNHDNIAYVLTAEHVINSAFLANRTVAIFNYESPWCNGPDGSVMKSISGADLVAYNSDIDFSLIKLSEFPPILYKPYMAGWDVTANTPVSTWSIHHPSGDVKKISVDYNPPEIGTFEGLYTDGFWHILQWDEGTTEGGSSGSPLFNENHRIVGTLTGGSATCGNSVNDYYSRLHISYDLSASTLYSLKPWLDNKNIGNLTLSGRDPYINNYTDSDTLFNGTESNVYSISEYTGGQTGFSTGINSDSLLAYAERFEVSEAVEITDVFLYVASSAFVNANDSVSIYIYDDNNGPDNIIASTKVLIKETKDDYLLRADFEEPVAVSGIFYVAYRNWYVNEAVSEPRQFAVYHGSGASPGTDFAWFMDESGWYPFDQHPYEPGENTLYIKAVVVETGTIVSGRTELPVLPDVKVYPNPFKNSITVESPDPAVNIESASILDMKGRIISRYDNINSNTFTIASNKGLDPGIYILDLLVSGQHIAYRIIKE